jgi:exosortase
VPRIVENARWFQASTARLIAVLVFLGWSNWPAIVAVLDRASSDSRYTHCLMVPVFSLYLLWRKRTLCPGPTIGSNGWGLLLIAISVILQLGGSLIFFGWIEGMAFIVGLGGAVTLWGGPKALKWASLSLVFLAFMIPLPYRVEVALGAPLQKIGTLASTFSLQTLGLAAVAEGNTIQLNDHASIAVVEACNGLGMLAAFACYATAAVILMENRDPITRSIILLSAVPLALVANIARITSTGIVHATIGGGAADHLFHDLAGWLMMPLALSLLLCESSLLRALILIRENEESVTSSLKTTLAKSAGSIP